MGALQLQSWPDLALVPCPGPGTPVIGREMPMPVTSVALPEVAGERLSSQLLPFTFTHPPSGVKL